MPIKALPFSNANGQWVSLGATLALTGDFTIEFWVNRVVGPTGGGEGYKDAVISHSGTAGPSINYYADQLRLYDGSTDQIIASATTPTGWEHGAIVRTGTSFKIYKNSVLDASATGANNSSATMNFTSLGLGDGSVYFADFNGLEEVRVWNVARTAGEIAANYNKTVDPATSGLVAYFNFAEADASTTVTDIVAGTYTGTLQGSPTATRVTATAPVSNPAAVITSQPQTQSVPEGQTATFNVTATGTGTLHYQWKVNGGNVGSDQNSYVRSSVTYADNNSSVAVDVTDDSGTITSNTVALIVYQVPLLAWYFA